MQQINKVEVRALVGTMAETSQTRRPRHGHTLGDVQTSNPVKMLALKLEVVPRH